MRVFGNIISIITYILLMIVGFSFFLGFLALGLFVGLEATKILNVVIDYINYGVSISAQWVDSALDILRSIGIEIAEIDGKFMIENVPNWTAFLISIPFLIFSLLGLAIIIITQRTTSIRRRHNALWRKFHASLNSDYFAMTKDEIIKILNENDVHHKEKWKKAKLAKIAEKRIK